MKPPQLSIIIPVYNVSKYIKRCIDSILKQIDNNRVEIIIVDDESPDNSTEIAENLLTLNKHSSYKIIYQENRGLGGARNTGLRNAIGDYVWFVDSDDEIKDGAIANIIKYLNKQEVVIFDFEKCDADNVITSVHKYSRELTNQEGWEIESFFISNQAWTSVFRRTFLINNNLFFREKFLHEDGEFSMRVMCLAQKVYYYPLVIYRYYTRNSGSIMNSVSIKNQHDLLAYFDTANQLKAEHPLLSFNQEKVIYNHIRVALSVFFFNSTHLSVVDFKVFQKLVKTNRSMIWRSPITNSVSAYYRGLLFIELYFPFRFVYNFIFHKRLYL